MSVKQFLVVTAVMTSAIGLTLLLFPAFIANFFLPAPAHHESDIFIRFLGSTLIGYTYLNWHTAMSQKTKEMGPTLIGNFSTLLIAFVVSVIGVLAHDLKTTGLLIVLLHGVFATGFGWYIRSTTFDTSP